MSGIIWYDNVADLKLNLKTLPRERGNRQKLKVDIKLLMCYPSGVKWSAIDLYDINNMFAHYNYSVLAALKTWRR